jgi:carbonic anhydrase
MFARKVQTDTEGVMALELTRRMLLGCAGGGMLGWAAGLAMPGIAHAVHGAADKKTNLTPDQALALLKEGNARFVTDTPLHGAQDRAQRMAIARGQTPIAVLVACSDSRVPPELLFGRGLGELFIVRNAGNTVDTAALGSIQYGVAELGIPLIVVLGHERCGAGQAAVAVVKDDATFPGSIGQMIEPIIPAVLHAQHQEGDLLDNAVRENVRSIVMRLRTSPEPILVEPLQARRLKIVGARYDLDDGTVDWFLET